MDNLLDSGAGADIKRYDVGESGAKGGEWAGGGMIRSRFRSRTEHSLDDKGRLNFPSRFRDVLRQSGSEVLIVAPWNSHLRIYPIAEWEILETKLLTEGGQQEGLGDFIRYVIGGVIECSPDKQGRIRLSPDLRNDAGLDKEVVLTGMIDWVEIWDKQAWDSQTKNARENFDDHQASLSRLGIF